MESARLFFLSAQQLFMLTLVYFLFIPNKFRTEQHHILSVGGFFSQEMANQSPAKSPAFKKHSNAQSPLKIHEQVVCVSIFVRTALTEAWERRCLDPALGRFRVSDSVSRVVSALYLAQGANGRGTELCQVHFHPCEGPHGLVWTFGTSEPE